MSRDDGRAALPIRELDEWRRRALDAEGGMQHYSQVTIPALEARAERAEAAIARVEALLPRHTFNGHPAAIWASAIQRALNGESTEAPR